jgi:hypothetical protein
MKNSNKRIGAAILLIPTLAIMAVPYIRHAVGPPHEVTGVIETSGLLETGGTGLAGRAVTAASVRLTNGNGVRVAIPNGVPASVGSKVLLNEYTQNFGQPKYSLIRLISENDRSH